MDFMIFYQFTKLFKTPQVGFEPTTNRLTAERSTTELLRKYFSINNIIN